MAAGPTLSAIVRDPAQRGIAVDDDRHDRGMSAGDVCESVPPLGPETSCESVADHFARRPDLFAQPIVDDTGVPLGLLNRFRLLERLSRRFGRDLFLRRPIAECLEGEVLLLDEETPIEDVGSRLFAGDRTHVLDGFIVTREGRYRGVGTGVTLTRALSELMIARAHSAADKAARESTAKSAFIARVTHEIRTPLNGVIGLTTLLHDTPLTVDQRSLVDLLRLSGDALLALIDDVLDYSKIEASEIALESLAFNPRDVLTDAVKILGVRAEGKGLAVRTDVEPAVPVSVIGDAKRLRQVLLNLGGNAVKFTERGQVAFGMRVLALDDEQVRIEVRVEDTGIGIPAESLGRLFRPFSQVDSTRSRRYGGTGLGLAISREIIEAMGGEIGVQSEDDRGSTFVVAISFPLGTGPSETQLTSVRSAAFDDSLSALSVDPVRAAILGGARHRVLLAEDNQVNQLVAQRLLHKLGASVRVVADGRAAIDALANETYDLVLMDCDMPVMDGLQASRRIRAGEAGVTSSAIPIVALTASATPESQASCLDAGMNGYLTKPITPGALSQELSKWWRLGDQHAVSLDSQ